MGPCVIIKPMIGEWEVPRIERIRTLEDRRLARIPIPGLRGDLQQDLGAKSLLVEISGSLHGDETRDEFLTSLREQFAQGEPVTFVADILTATELEEVLIERLDLVESNDWASGFRYRIVLRESVEPPPPPAPFDDLGLGLDTELDLLAELGLDGLELPDLLGDIPALGNPTEPVKPALEGVRAATGGLGGLLDGLKGKLA
jgi:hypothetical protein